LQAVTTVVAIELDQELHLVVAIRAPRSRDDGQDHLAREASVVTGNVVPIQVRVPVSPCTRRIVAETSGLFWRTMKFHDFSPLGMLNGISQTWILR
jgi:hypothetical protein